MNRKKLIIILAISNLFLITLILFIIVTKQPNDAQIKFIVNEKNNKTFLKLETNDEYQIYYTIDGSIPNKKSNLFEEEIEINKNTSPNTLTDKTNSEKIYGKEILYDESLPKATVIRAIAISQSGSKSKVFTKTIFTDTNIKEYFSNITVVSLVTDPSNLLDYKKGIMVKGEIYDKWLKDNNKIINKEDEVVDSEFVEGNFMEHGKEWEREGNIEIYDNSNESIINELIGLRIKGNISRQYNQKSFNIYFREEYDKKYINYELWENSKNIHNDIINKYSSLTIRNGGNDTEGLKFKDSWLQQLVENRSVDIQQSKPAILFLNGEYWGVYNLQEKYSKDYYAEHYNLNKDNIIAIKEDELDIGKDSDYKKYEELMSYAKKDLTNKETYQEFLKLIDLQSMLDYYAIETYINNSDWGIDSSGTNKNVLLWRTREKENNEYGDTKWRWSLYDLEFSSSMYNINTTSADFCAIKNAKSKHPLFESAMKNEEFNKQFYDTYYELKKENFNLEKIKDSIQKEFLLWQPLMKDHYKRFGNTDTQRFISRNSIINYFEKKIYSNPC